MTNIQEIFKKSNVAVITGGASGIGLAAAEHFVKAGMNVVIADLGGDRLANARQRARSHCGRRNL